MSEILSNLENSLNKNTFWDEYRSFCSNLHQAEVNTDHFLLLLPDILKQIENNGLSYQIYDAVNKLCESWPENGAELLNKIKDKENTEMVSLIPSILDGMGKSSNAFNKFTEAEFLLKNNSDELKKQGYAFLITLTEEEFGQNRDFRDFIYNLITTDIDNGNVIFYSQISRVLGKFIKVIPRADEYLISLSGSGAQDVLYQMARILGYEIDFKSNPQLYMAILLNLAAIDSGCHGIISQLNYSVLHKLIIGSPESIDQFLQRWLLFDTTRSGEIIKFSDALEQLQEKNSGYFIKMVTAWLNSDEAVLHEAVSRLLMEMPHYKFKSLELDETYIVRLNVKDIKFITSKIVGYVYFKELIRSSIFSILKAKIDDEQCVIFLKAIFNDYIVFNYPSTIEYLEDEKKKSSKKVQRAITEIIEFNKNYYEKINQLDFINEFNPSDKRLKIYNNIHQKGFQIKQKAAEENRHSFLSMCKNIQLRTGKGMFSKYQGQYTEKTEMSRIQYSTEFPRGEFIDAIGQEKIRAVYRNYIREI